MRIIFLAFFSACLAGCTFYGASKDERAEFRGRTAETLGVPVADVQVFNFHALMLNTNWSAKTARGLHYYCSRDLNDDVSCRRD